MKQLFSILFIIFLFFGCVEKNSSVYVDPGDVEALNQAIEKAVPGDEIILRDGTWQDVEIRFRGEGNKNQPIVLKAENPGQVFVEGKSDLKFAGKYLEVNGLYFRNGYSPSNSVIDFRTNKNELGFNCRVTQCVIKDFNQPQRDKRDHWVEFWGRNNQMDHCYLSGKSNMGPTIRVMIKGNQSIRNYHQIVNNHFGPKPRKGGPRGESIQLGDSGTSMSPSNTLVANNYFEECNGEVEVISSKTNYNEFRNNVFYKCEGSLVMRHGNYCQIDGNIFIGDGKSENYGGVRMVNTGHWVTNNYFFGLKGKGFRAPLAVMNGIPKSPLNRYNQVTDIVVAHNTWVDCSSPFQVGIGNNTDQSEVLPKSEIRSARPVRALLANNLIINAQADDHPILAIDSLDGIEFENNYIDNKGRGFKYDNLFKLAELDQGRDERGFFYPEKATELEILKGFDFEIIEKDLFGNARSKRNMPGAICQPLQDIESRFDLNGYGPDWYPVENKKTEKKNNHVAVGTNNLLEALKNAGCGDTLLVEAGTYVFEQKLEIKKKITIKSADKESKAVFELGEGSDLIFEMHPGGDLYLEGLILSGGGKGKAFASLEQNMSYHYDLKLIDCEIREFKQVLFAYKETFAEYIIFEGCLIENCDKGIELAAETNDKGDYNAEFLTFKHCSFKNINGAPIDYYRGGYDESTIGGNLLIENSDFQNCGATEKSGLLIKNRGIVNVAIINSEFRNNPVKQTAILWGAKNNTHSNNEYVNTAGIKVVENLKLALMY